MMKINNKFKEEKRMKKLIIILCFFILFGCNVDEIKEQVDEQRNTILEHFLVETDMSIYKSIMEKHLDEMICIKSSDENGYYTDWYFSETSLPVIRKANKIPEGPVYYIFVYDGEFEY